MQVKLLLVTFYLNGGLHAVTIGKSSEWMTNYWTIRFFKKRLRTEFRFSVHLYLEPIKSNCCNCYYSTKNASKIPVT